MYKKAHLLSVLVMISLFAGCASIPGSSVPDNVNPIVAQKEISEDRLLNCYIKVFDPGKLTDDSEKKKGLSPEIRKAESRFMPIHLKYTMQKSGYWGTVRVVPNDDTGTDLIVKGRIEYSDSETTSITIEAVDARNVIWFKKTYRKTITPKAYNNTELEKKDAFQDLYNAIANDLADYRNHLDPEEIKRIKEVAKIRYAAEMAPDAFKDYLSKDSDGIYHLVHLPARNDPMFKRVAAIKSRDDMMIDIINGYYDNYYRGLWQPYNDWRKARIKELVVMHKIEHQALTREALGIASIIGAIVLSLTGSNDLAARTSTLRNVMIMGGAAAVYSGYQKKKETELNKAAIEELGNSFSSEAKPLVMEVEGQTIRLTGSAEQQYRHWRQILKQIYTKETKIPVENSSSKTEPNPSDIDKQPIQR